MLSRRAVLGMTAAATLATPTPAAALTPPGAAVFVAPHQDDEMLSMGGAIINHVRAGREVHVVLLGRGDGTSVRTRHMPKVLGRTPPPHEIGALRDREFTEACARLGVAPERVHVLPYEDRLPERHFTADGVVRAIRACVGPGADLKTTSPYDPNPDHQAAAAGVAALAGSGWTDYEARYYLAPSVTPTVDVRVFQERGGAVSSWHQWPYRHRDACAGWWGVGYRSVPAMFDHQITDPYSYWHA